MKRMDRRDFLKAGGLAALGLVAGSPRIFQGKLLGAAPPRPRKLLFIFQRGGNDGVNTLIPRGDPEYNQQNRPTLFIDPSEGLDLGNGFAQLHPAMSPLLEVYNSQSLNGIPGPGNLAVLHRIGYQGQSQSHFDSQQFWENGIPGKPNLEEGMIYRQVAQTLDPQMNHLAAISLSSSQMVALKGTIPLPTVANTQSFTLSGTTAKVKKFLGALPTTPSGQDGTGILGAYGGSKDIDGQLNRALVYDSGLVLADAVQTIGDAVAQGPYTPENGASYPDGSFGQKLQQAAMLFKRTPVQVLGANLGGWDLHTAQGGARGNHANLLGTLAKGIQALWLDLRDQWQDLVIVTMTEFGRTSKENGSKGTDHAYACVICVAGGPVKGGVYNCDASTWSAGDLFSQDGRYVKHRTDYRTVFWEIFTRHFGDAPDLVESVIPGYTQAAAARPQDFAFLGFL